MSSKSSQSSNTRKSSSSSSSRKKVRHTHTQTHADTEASPSLSLMDSDTAGTVAFAPSASAVDSTMEVDYDEEKTNASQQQQQQQQQLYEDKMQAFLEENGLQEKSTEFRALRNNSELKEYSEEVQLAVLRVNFGLKGANAKDALSLLLGSTGRKSGNLSSGRGPNILDGLETELVHNYDFDKFTQRVFDLFKWHTDTAVRQVYMAPYFALIQSSGMGKTKLFAEFRKHLNKQKDSEVQCMAILCINANLKKEKQDMYFDHELLFDVSAVDIVDDVRTKLNELLPKQGEFTKLVLLFDEAQGLMKGRDKFSKGSLMFRAIRWWLREQRNIMVVAAFAGTNANLSNFYPPDPPVEGASRAARIFYKNYQKNEKDDKKLYPPFFELHTISCFAAKTEQRKRGNDEPGFPQALVYGRPLFAYYYIENDLDDRKLTEFASRLVLSVNEYGGHLPSCYSVLGARVQMGIVNSFDTLSTLVSAGYACLVDFQQQENATSTPMARLNFMPDPLCATLAMRYMDKDWRGLGFEGKCGRFWVQQAEKAFSTKLCLPEKGDAGEIFAALYMLLCGDILRRENDPTCASFAVSIDEWFHLLKSGGELGAALTEAPSLVASKASPSLAASTKNLMSTTVSTRSGLKQQKTMADAMDTTSKSTISFVQVCRNDFRANSFCDEEVMKHMYVSGLANYAYKNCKAIDIASAIKVVRNAQTCYHPLLISVKNCATVTKDDVVGWLSSLMAFLQEIRQGKEEQQHPRAVCLVILLGCMNPPKIQKDNLDSLNLQPFPSDDVFRLVTVPETDSFGVSEAISNLGAASEKCEIYSSHGFLARENTADSLLRKKSPNRNMVNSLFEALRALRVSNKKKLNNSMNGHSS